MSPKRNAQKKEKEIKAKGKQIQKKGNEKSLEKKKREAKKKNARLVCSLCLKEKGLSKSTKIKCKKDVDSHAESAHKKRKKSVTGIKLADAEKMVAQGKAKP